jgi:fermentation-respiration switch protein FrsA (DUF1100 family)
VDNRNPAAVDGLLAALPAGTQRLLDELSPERRLSGLAAPLFLVHGRDDPAVPYTESLRLLTAARAADRTARAAIVGGVGHVAADRRGGVADLARLAAAFHAFRKTARASAPRLFATGAPPREPAASGRSAGPAGATSAGRAP